MAHVLVVRPGAQEIMHWNAFLPTYLRIEHLSISNTDVVDCC